jgi:hypothetical protein
MLLRLGYELCSTFPAPTAAILTLNVHHTRVSVLLHPDHVRTEPSLPMRG